MIQYVNVEDLDNILNQEIIAIEVRKGDRIFSKEKNVAEVYAMYEGFIEDPKEFGEIDDYSIKTSLVTDVTSTYATVQLNKKYSTTIDISKEKKEYVSYIQPNAVLNFKVHQKGGNLLASFSDAVVQTKFDSIINSIDKNVAFLAKVEELVNGGYYVTIDGITAFMPGSLASMNKLTDFESLLGKELYVKVVNYSKQFNKIVVSHEDYLKQLIPMEIDRIDYKAIYKGRITGVSKFGIFAEFNTDSDLEKPFILTGLIPSSEMDPLTRDLFNSRGLKSGDEIGFYVKTVVSSSKIILTKIFIDWDETFNSFEKGKKVNCKIVKIKDNVIFAAIDNTDLIGTISNYDKECKEGDILKLAISFIDTNSKKIFLKAY